MVRFVLGCEQSVILKFFPGVQLCKIIIKENYQTYYQGRPIARGQKQRNHNSDPGIILNYCFSQLPQLSLFDVKVGFRKGLNIKEKSSHENGHFWKFGEGVIKQKWSTIVNLWPKLQGTKNHSRLLEVWPQNDRKTNVGLWSHLYLSDPHLSQSVPSAISAILAIYLLRNHRSAGAVKQPSLRRAALLTICDKKNTNMVKLSAALHICWQLYMVFPSFST